MAIPFIPEPDPRMDTIEALLKRMLEQITELVDLLRWSQYFGTNVQDTIRILNSDEILNTTLHDQEFNRWAADDYNRQFRLRRAQELQQRQQLIQEQYLQHEQQQQQRQRQQRQPLPDLIPSPEVADRRTGPVNYGRMEPVTLQIQVCPVAYKNRQLKILSMTKNLTTNNINGNIAQQNNGAVLPDQSTHNHDDEPPAVVQDQSKLQRFMSMIKPSSIFDKSVYVTTTATTALAVMIGWRFVR